MPILWLFCSLVAHVTIESDGNGVAGIIGYYRYRVGMYGSG